MCLINELARFNKTTHQYRLTDESGPPHKKSFTVRLKIGGTSGANEEGVIIIPTPPLTAAQQQRQAAAGVDPAAAAAAAAAVAVGEEYAASGPSIKKAQHAAAAIALERTQLRHPPPKARVVKNSKKI